MPEIASDQVVYNNKQLLLSRWLHTKPIIPAVRKV